MDTVRFITGRIYFLSFIFLGLTKGVDGRFESIASFGSYPPVNHQVDCLGVGFALIHGCLGILEVDDLVHWQ